MKPPRRWFFNRDNGVASFGPTEPDGLEVEEITQLQYYAIYNAQIAGWCADEDALDFVIARANLADDEALS